MFKNPCKECLVQPTCINNCKSFEEYALKGNRKISLLVVIINSFIGCLCGVSSLFVQKIFNLDPKTIETLLISITIFIPFAFSLFYINKLYNKSHKRAIDLYFKREKIKLELGIRIR